MSTLWMWALAASAVAAEPSLLTEAVALHLGIDGRVVDQETVGAAYDAACTAGDELACKWRSWDQFGQPKLEALGRLMLGSCERGEAEACVAFAWTVGLSADRTWDAEVAPDPTRAAVLMRQACDAGSARGCAELGTLHERGYALPVEVDDAKVRYAAACEAGLGAGCVRRAALADDPAEWLEKAAEAGSPQVLADPEACAAGVVEACAAELERVDDDAEARMALLERLCRMEDARCAALMQARASGDPGPRGDLPERDPDEAWVHDGGVLVGWRGTTWTPHRWYGPDEIDEVQVLVSGPRREVVRVSLASDDEEAPVMQLPGSTCDTVVPQVTALADAHRVRAIDEAGLPMASACLDAVALGERPEYFAGTLLVESDNTDMVNEAMALRAHAAESSAGLYACGDAVDRDKVLDSMVVEVMVKRGGELKKVKLSQTSGDDGFDDCVSEWLLAMPPADEIALTTWLRMTTRLLW